MGSNVGSRAFQNARQQKKLKKQAETLLAAAFTAYREGRQADAQSLCRELLQEQPNCFEALHILGVSIVHGGRFAEGLPWLERAVALDPGSAEAQSNLGFALLNLARYDEARAHLQKAIVLQPNFPTAQRNLADTLLHLKLPEPALAAFIRAIQLKPDDADAWSNRAVAELMLGRWDAATASSERALALRPGHVEALINNGQAQLELRHFAIAEAAFNAALAIQPNRAELLAHRGRLYLLMDRRAQSEADYDAALALDRTLIAGWQGKAELSILNGNLAQATAACNKLLEQNPRSEVGLTLRGACLGRLGDPAGAIQQFDSALEIRPDYAEAISKKIFYQDFVPESDFAVQQATRRAWWDVYGCKFPRRILAARALDPNKRIVIGYVSSDFRMHSAAFAFLPVLRNHDKTRFQVNCYASSTARDSFTETFRSLADVWVDVSALSDDELADRIQADGVDILVDLSGHTTGNRLNVFARKPAPVQVTAWGNGTGTGLATMDYIFADPVSIPLEARSLFAEAVYDLPSVITIDPIVALKPSALPMRANGHVTFGVFNRVSKISDSALALWCRLLREIDGARLIVKDIALSDPMVRDMLLARFLAHGTADGRVICLGGSERHDHLRAFAQIDIALDPFPQNGGISTWEALYMGVPVVAKLGRGAASRMAGGILRAIGLDDWVADDDDGYVAIAKRFAAQPDQLEQLRAELPDIIARKPAGDVAVYTQQVEAGYRQFWRDHCAAAARG
ncbi:tetratricopeptide repeat protein [Bradyrhizobium sp. HKCCYLS1011]|uniref:O-linked N-acetylglucosamine transferase, SPINDLY family protein n=1 Tax=Bradyrhizobium sp. HKCCYLS1011 TaxID=3420733 RepID=UPI003EC0119F